MQIVNSTYIRGSNRGGVTKHCLTLTHSETSYFEKDSWTTESLSKCCPTSSLTKTTAQAHAANTEALAQIFTAAIGPDKAAMQLKISLTYISRG